jgi:uncharacterized membrane protein
MRKKLLWAGVVILVILFLGSFADDDKKQAIKPLEDVKVEKPTRERSFAMGFTSWPPDLTLSGAEEMWNFMSKHGDIMAFHIDRGMPWAEASNGEAFSAEFMEDWDFNIKNAPKNKQIYLALTPLNEGRDGIAPYIPGKNHESFPREWKNIGLYDEKVKNAYLTYATRAIEHYKPDYLAIGIEVNVLLTKDKKQWNEYKELHKYTYAELKKKYPHLPIFATFSINHLKGIESGSNEKEHVREIRSLLPYIDIVGISAYPYGWAFKSGVLRPVPDNYFDIALQFGKPIAIAETGMPTRDFKSYGVNYKFSEGDQKQYIDMLLRKATEHDFIFVINWSTIDFDKLLLKLPKGDIRDFATFFAYTGLQTSDGKDKAALEVWDNYLNL